jgi:hypothetical protein
VATTRATSHSGETTARGAGGEFERGYLTNEEMREKARDCYVSTRIKSVLAMHLCILSLRTPYKLRIGYAYPTLYSICNPALLALCVFHTPHFV